MRDLQKMLESSGDLKRAIASRILDKNEVEKAFEVLFKEAGFDDLTGKFIKVLSQNRRIDILPEIIKAFFELLAEKNGEINAEVTTAAAMTKEENAKLANILTKISGKKVRMLEKQDAKILGGFKVKLGARMLDASIAGKLERLRVELEKSA